MENSNIYENNGRTAIHVIILSIVSLINSDIEAQRVPEGYDCFQRDIVEYFELDKLGIDSLRVSGYTQGGISRNEPMNETVYVFKDSLLVEILDKNCRRSLLEIRQSFEYDTLKRRKLWKYEDLMKKYSQITYVHYKYSEEINEPDSIFISESRYGQGEGWDELVYKDSLGRKIKHIWRTYDDTLTSLTDYIGDTTIIRADGSNTKIAMRIIWQEPRKPINVEHFGDIFEYYWNKNRCSIYLTETDLNQRYLLQQAYLTDSGLPTQMEVFLPDGSLYMIYFYEYFPKNLNTQHKRNRQAKGYKRKCRK